jgi:hypothetical protein
MATHHPAADPDRSISAAVRALAAGRGITHADVAHAVEVATATFNRRLAHGGWTAAELVRLAVYFDVPVTSLLSGLDGQVAPTIRPLDADHASAHQESRSPTA